MRDMVHTNPPASPPPARRPRLVRLRPWVQTAFLAVWLGPLGLRMLWLPSCVFHCYGCPLASFACPVGVVAGMTALHVLPLLAIGVVAAVAAMVGSLVCGWACPFGFLQDLLHKIPVPKFRLPGWSGHLRLPLFLGLVVAVPYWTRSLFFCDVCPSGTINRLWQQAAGIPLQFKTPEGLVAIFSLVFLAVVLALALFTLRPFCNLLCPIGGFLGLFNRISGYHVAVDKERCADCGRCQSLCPQGIDPVATPGHSQCNLCLECTRACRFIGSDIRL